MKIYLSLPIEGKLIILSDQSISLNLISLTSAKRHPVERKNPSKALSLNVLHAFRSFIISTLLRALFPIF